MNDREPEWFDKLRNTGRCRAEVQEAAGWFRGLESVDYEDIIRGLIGRGEDRQLGILLNICSVNRVRIEPRLLAETLKVVEPLTDLAPPYRDQDEASIAPLLEAAERI
ncbi:MAG: hypothetical protein PHS17_11140 [Desulfobacterales bacterium]|nr:hypothetical protein [Desulfobacterales bacterium]